MSSFQFDAPAEQVSAVDQTGIIARQVGNQECALARFDNATGRTNGASGCTNGVVFDAHGIPVPVGTIHRLDAISKSFSGGCQVTVAAGRSARIHARRCTPQIARKTLTKLTFRYEFVSARACHFATRV